MANKSRTLSWVPAFYSPFLNWIYWGYISSQNHIGFKCTTQQNIICALHHVPITPSKFSFHFHLTALVHLHLHPLPSPSGYHHIVVCVYVICRIYHEVHIHMYVYVFIYLYRYIFCLIPSPSFIQLPAPFPFDSCQSIPCIHASVSILFISLFCSLDSTYKWDHMVFVFLWLA